jgi:putative DNA primase/helicase
MLSKLAPVSFDPDADSPLWSAFLHKIMAGNPELIGFVQRAVGYSLTGDTSEQKFFVCWGGGANGKSTLLRTVQAMLGAYAVCTSIETLVVKRGSSATNDVARLAGARLVSAVEAEDGQRLAEERVKHMTGGDAIAARFLYHEHFEFRPTFKLWLATNHRPQVRGTDEAIWRRINLVPFTVSIPESEQDRKLPEKLEAELPGILAWSVAGCLRWQADGLATPGEVRAATDEYRRAEDTIGSFLEDCCDLFPDAITPARELYAAYVAWCERTGEKSPLSQKKLGPRLRERGLRPIRNSATYRHEWQGVALVPSGGSL